MRKVLILLSVIFLACVSLIFWMRYFLADMSFLASIITVALLDIGLGVFFLHPKNGQEQQCSYMGYLSC